MIGPPFRAHIVMPSARRYLVIAAAASQTRLLDGAPVTGLLAELYESFQAAERRGGVTESAPADTASLHTDQGCEGWSCYLSSWACCSTKSEPSAVREVPDAAKRSFLSAIDTALEGKEPNFDHLAAGSQPQGCYNAQHRWTMPCGLGARPTHAAMMQSHGMTRYRQSHSTSTGNTYRGPQPPQDPKTFNGGSFSFAGGFDNQRSG